jgi:hypothetical protein
LYPDGSPLSAVAWKVGRLDVFGIGPDLTLRHWWFDNGSWNPQETIGPQTLSAQGGLCAISLDDQLLDIFGIGSNGTLLRWWYDQGWHNDKQPQDLGGQLLGSALSATSWGQGRLDIFGVAVDETISYWWYDNGSGNFYTFNTQPELVGGPFGDVRQPWPLTAFTNGHGRMHVFAYGTDGTNIQLLYWEAF